VLFAVEKWRGTKFRRVGFDCVGSESGSSARFISAVQSWAVVFMGLPALKSSWRSSKYTTSSIFALAVNSINNVAIHYCVGPPILLQGDSNP